jgi:hypothetical protein
MIAVQSVLDRIASDLDSEGSDRYTFDRDFKFAINSSVEWLQAVFNQAYGNKKWPEENMRDLVRVAVFQASSYSRISTDLLPDSIWSLLRLNVKPVLNNASPSITPTTNPSESFYRSDLSYISSDFDGAKKLTLEQWEENAKNIFEAGNTILENDFKQYAYLSYVDYQSSSYDSQGPEVEIRPSVADEFVAITYLKYPTPITDPSDNIEFPKVLINLVVDKALNFISRKQGDQTNLYSVTQQDISTLVQLMI